MPDCVGEPTLCSACPGGQASMVRLTMCGDTWEGEERRGGVRGWRGEGKGMRGRGEGRGGEGDEGERGGEGMRGKG